MSYYRYALRYPYCKKVYADECYNAIHDLSKFSTSLCPKCGEVSGAFDKVVVRPKLFGLLGWGVKEKNESSASD